MSPVRDLLQASRSRAGAGAAAGEQLDGPVVLHREGRFSVLLTEGPAPTALGERGPWKRVGGEAGPMSVCELPDTQTRSGASVANGLLAAAIRYGQGLLVDEPIAPLGEQRLDELRERLTPEALLVRAGAHVCQGRAVLEPETQRLEFSLVPAVRLSEQATPEQIRAALALVLADAQECWRMVRLGLADSAAEPPVARAELDLSGAPEVLLDSWLATGLCALRQAVRWVLPSISLILESGQESRTIRRVVARSGTAEGNPS